jgi:hypothetical protein
LLKSLKVIWKAIGSNWLKLPGSILSIGVFLSAAAKQYGFDWIPNFEIKTLILIGLSTVFVWFVLGLSLTVLCQARRIEELDSAWDRTDKFLIPIKEAILHVANVESAYLGLPEEEKIHRASVKLRTLAHENQMCFWGRKVHVDQFDSQESYDEHHTQVPPSLMVNSMIDESTINESNANLRSRTTADPNYNLETRVPDMFCDLKVSRHTLLGMFPETLSNR